MTKILQSIPYPTYTTIERDALVDVLLNTKINNSDTGKVEEYDGVNWVSQSSGSGGTIFAANVITTPTATLLSTNQEAANAELDSKKANKVLSATDGNMLKVKMENIILLKEIMLLIYNKE